MEIVGVSFSDPSANEDWAQDESFEFQIWTDSDKDLALYYEAIDSDWAFVPGRITVLLDEEGNLALGYYSGISVGTHPAQVLEDAEKLFGP